MVVFLLFLVHYKEGNGFIVVIPIVEADFIFALLRLLDREGGRSGLVLFLHYLPVKLYIGGDLHVPACNCIESDSELRARLCGLIEAEL